MRAKNMISRRGFLKAAVAASTVSALALTGCGSSASSTASSAAASEAASESSPASESAAASEEAAASSEAAALDTDALFAKFAEGKNDVLVYRLYTPETADTKVPLVLYMHGADAIGDDNVSQMNSGNAYTFVTDEMQQQHPCYVLAPQLPERFTAANESPTDKQTAKGWTDEEVQDALIQTIKEIAETNGNVDMDRIYVTGHSMGALGVWGMISAYPDVFAAAVPISGLWDGSVDNMTDMPIWIFHGENDELVPLERETTLRDQLQEKGGKVIMTIYTDADFAAVGETNAHQANVPTYANKAVHDWLFAQKK